MRLRDESYGYGQYIHYDDTTKREHPPGLRVLPGLGTMVRIFDIRSPQSASVADLRDCREMFPPVFVSLLGAVRRKRWRIIGHLGIPSFAYPRFRHTFNTKPGKHDVAAARRPAPIAERAHGPRRASLLHEINPDHRRRDVPPRLTFVRIGSIDDTVVVHNITLDEVSGPDHRESDVVVPVAIAVVCHA